MSNRESSFVKEISGARHRDEVATAVWRLNGVSFSPFGLGLRRPTNLDSRNGQATFSFLAPPNVVPSL